MMKRQIVLWLAGFAFCHAQTFRGGVECEMDNSDLTYVVPGEDPGSWEVPITSEAAILPDAILVRECWCARLLQDEYAFCPPAMDTCTVMAGELTCRISSTQLDVARAIWPFALFMLFTWMYLVVASRTGKLARGYVRRQFGNFAVCICKQSPDDRESRSEEGRYDDPPSSGTIQRDEEQGVLGLGVPGIGAGSVNQQAGETVTETSPAMTVALPTNYPVEIFGRQSNFDQLLNELYHMRNTRQHDQVASLWFSAWARERRAALRAERQVRLRSWLSGRPSDDNENTPQERTRTMRLELKTSRFQSSSMSNRVSGSGIQVEQRNDLGVSSSRPKGEDANDAAVDTTFDEDFEPVDENACAICLCNVEDGEIVGDIPCQHVFHKECLKAWLTRSSRCPLCQNVAVKTFLDDSMRPSIGAWRTSENRED